jgi:chromosome segregation ATPase
MSSSTLVTSIVTAVLGSGVAGTIVQLIHARNTRRDINLKALRQPAEIDQVVLGGASQAVTLLTSSLTWAEEELADLRRDNVKDRKEIRRLGDSIEAKDARIRELEGELLILRDRLNQSQARLGRALEQIAELKEGGHGNGHTVVQ